MGRAPCCDKASVKKGPWSPEEDATLKSYIEEHGTGGNWIALPQKIGLKRCGKSCRLRWLNYLRPNIKHGGFSEEEDRLICSLYLSIGSRWSIIAAQLPGRTDNDIKNYWNTRLKKKLLGKQRKDNELRKPKPKLVAMDGNVISTFNNQPMFPLWSSLPPYVQHTMDPISSTPLTSFNVEDHSVSMRKVTDGCDPSLYYNHSVNLHPPFPNTTDPQISNQLMMEMMKTEYNLDNYNMGSSSSSTPGVPTATFPAELEELMSSNPFTHQINGLDLVTWEGTMINNSGSGSDQTSCGESQAGSWGELCSIISLPMAAEELRYSGE